MSRRSIQRRLARRDKKFRRWATQEKRPASDRLGGRCNRDQFGLIVKKDGAEGRRSPRLQAGE